MSWAVKYRLEISDLQGIAWKVDIEEDAFAGTITNLVGDSDPIRFEWENSDDYVFDPIKSSKAFITVKSTTDFALADLYSDQDLNFRVRIYQSTTLYWLGYIVTSNYAEPYEMVPYPVTIVAWDGMTYLRNILFDNVGTYYNGRIRESEIVINILGKIGHTGFTEYVNIYEESMVVTTSDSPFDQNKIDVDLFRDRYCDEVLAELLKKYNACIIHNAGTFVIYRPKELTGATVYGRIFTASTTKTATSFTSVQYIDRSAHSSVFKQVSGGVMMIQRPAKSVKINQDYGYKESWLDNYELSGDTWAASEFQDWTTGAGIALARSYIPGEFDGAGFVADSSNPPTVEYMEQAFGTYGAIDTSVYGFDFDYNYNNRSGAAINSVYFVFMLKDSAETKFAYVDTDNQLKWRDTTPDFIDFIFNAAPGISGWQNQKFTIPDGLPVAGPYKLRIYGLASPGSLSINFAIKNIKIYATADSITTKRRPHKGPFPRLARWVLGLSKFIDTYIDTKEVVESTYEPTVTPTAGEDLKFDYQVGDVTDSGITNVLEQFAGAIMTSITTITNAYRVDTVTLTGTSGTADIVCDGVTSTALFDTSPTDTATNFVTAFASDYLGGGVVVTSTGASIFFTSNVLGAEFTGNTSITNVTGDLTGSASTATPASTSATVEAHSTDWNTRGGSESKALLRIIGDEITAQHARPKQLIQMPIQETGSAPIALNVIGHFEDDSNQISAANRKFVFNRGEFGVKMRRWNIDLIEIL